MIVQIPKKHMDKDENMARRGNQAKTWHKPMNGVVPKGSHVAW